MNKFKPGDVVVVSHEGPLRCVGWIGTVTEATESNYTVRFFSREAVHESQWTWYPEDLTHIRDTKISRIPPNLV